MHRRGLLAGALASFAGGAAAFALAGRARAEDKGGDKRGGDAPAGGDAIPIADMHAHLFFIGPKPALTHPLAPAMASGRVNLMAWSLVGDMPWIRPSATGLRQKSAPKPGASTAWFHDELRRVKEHVAGQKLAIARTPEDLDKALAGEPHVLQHPFMRLR